MPKKLTVPTDADVAKKWADVTPGRSTYYQANTPAAASKWEARANGSSGVFQAAISSGDMAKKYAGGIKKAGGAKFARKVTDVGAGRFGPGVSAAQPDMQAGVAPFLATLAATEIPDRGPRGSPGNYQIVQKVGDPLHAKRLALLGAS